MKLLGYWRSTSSYRLRIALQLKGLTPDYIPIHLVRDGGEHLRSEYREYNPQARVPILVLEDDAVLIQSPAIIEYLEEKYPSSPLLPTGLVDRARVRAVAAIIGCDIHPLHNVGPLNFLRRELGCNEEQVKSWISRWIGDGLAAIEQLIDGPRFCFGLTPGLADAYLIPQVYAARRFGIPLDAYPKVLGVEAASSTHPSIVAAHPSRQIDAEERS